MSKTEAVVGWGVREVVVVCVCVFAGEGGGCLLRI